ncbi:MAG TPA: YdcF family protein [Gemmatimonadales bacterium]|nr:YdcF family protein [Gemmatimonadales bacterium]
MPFWTFRRAAAAALGLGVLAGLSWAAVVVAVAVTATRGQAAPADAIVVLGAAQYNGRPSPVFRARLDHAAALYVRGYAPVILVTGGVGRGDTLSEAEVGQRYLVQAGLPSDAVIALAPTRSTYRALRAVADWFGPRASRRALFVSDGFHMLRLRLVAPRLGLVPLTSPAPGSPIHASARRNLGYILAEGFKVPAAWLLHH